MSFMQKWKERPNKRKNMSEEESVENAVEQQEEHEEQQKEQQKKEGLEEAVWMKRMFSHNVRMPMSIITGYGELLKQGLLDEAEKEKSIHAIGENITYMNEVLNVIFGENIGEKDKEEIIDLVELAEKMKKYVQDIADKMKISIQIRSGEKKMFIKAEKVPIMRIFYQLYENAFKYLKTGSEILVSIYKVENEGVMLVFKDNGTDLNVEEVQFLFEQGFRGTNSHNKPGNGFGLNAVKRIVEQYHGEISASGGGHKGLSIRMLFPVVEITESEELSDE